MIEVKEGLTLRGVVWFNACPFRTNVRLWAGWVSASPPVARPSVPYFTKKVDENKKAVTISRIHNLTSGVIICKAPMCRMGVLVFVLHTRPLYALGVPLPQQVPHAHPTKPLADPCPLAGHYDGGSSSCSLCACQARNIRRNARYDAGSLPSKRRNKPSKSGKAAARLLSASINS